MNEYIDREVVQEMLENAQMISNGEYCGYCTEDVRLNSIPAADVAEVRHGRWIPSDMGGGEPDEASVCSECGEPWTLIDGNPAENNMWYCPACGALMKEDEHEAG